MKGKVLCIVCLCLFVFVSLAPAEDTQKFVKAQIGVKLVSEEEMYPAAKSNRVAVGDKFQVYIVPRFNAYIYVVQSNQHTAVRLDAKEGKKIARKYPLRFPLFTNQSLLFETEPFYTIKNKQESITIICSKHEQVEIDDLFKGGSVPHKKWLEVEQALQKSRLDLSTPLLKPLNIAGTARDIKDDPFFKELQIFSGELLVITKYRFRAAKKRS